MYFIKAEEVIASYSLCQKKTFEYKLIIAIE